MQLSPQEVKELKESLKKIQALGHQIYDLAEERAREIDILDRRLSFLSHPAGNARKDDSTTESYSNNILKFEKKEN